MERTKNFAHVNSRRQLAALWLATYGVSGGSTDWVPSRDTDLDLFCQNFDTKITASPGTYALQASDATAFHTLRAAFTASLLVASTPATRTEVTVGTKDADKAALTASLRSLAGIVQASPAVQDDDRIALGLPVNNNVPSPIPAPETFPLLEVLKGGILTHELRFADELTPDSARKPSGAVALELYVSVSTAAVTNQAAMNYHGLVTRNPYLIEYDAPDDGKKAYIAGRWVTARGEVGPWSAIQSRTVAA